MSSTASDLEARVKALEAKVDAEVKGAWAWVKTNWAHFVTWVGVAYSLASKHL